METFAFILVMLMQGLPSALPNATLDYGAMTVTRHWIISNMISSCARDKLRSPSWKTDWPQLYRTYVPNG